MSATTPQWALELRAVAKAFAGQAVVREVTLAIRQGEFYSLLGPSGCGKTTLLRMIGGFEAPDAGEVVLGGVVANCIPPARRKVNMVFQHYALFPHLSVGRNVAFALELARTPKAEIARRVDEALALVRLEGLAGRYPRQLSGGQQQRVALARALVARPEVLLLDEPLGALDLQLRRAMQMELKALQQRLGITFVYVTHDQDEAMAMSDRIAVMRQGRVEQVGTPCEIYQRPASRFVAEFFGEANLFTGTVLGCEPPLVHITGEGGLRFQASADFTPRTGEAVTLGIRPEQVRFIDGDTAQPIDRYRGLVEEVVFLGAATRYRVRLENGLRLQVSRTGAPAPQHAAGQPVTIGWRTDDAHVIRGDR